MGVGTTQNVHEWAGALRFTVVDDHRGLPEQIILLAHGVGAEVLPAGAVGVVAEEVPEDLALDEAFGFASFDLHGCGDVVRRDAMHPERRHALQSTLHPQVDSHDVFGHRVAGRVLFLTQQRVGVRVMPPIPGDTLGGPRERDGGHFRGIFDPGRRLVAAVAGRAAVGIDRCATSRVGAVVVVDVVGRLVVVGRHGLLTAVVGGRQFGQFVALIGAGREQQTEQGEKAEVQHGFGPFDPGLRSNPRLVTLKIE